MSGHTEQNTHRIPSTESSCATLAHTDVVHEALLDEACDRLDDRLAADFRINPSALVQVDALRATQRAHDVVDTGAEVLGAATCSCVSMPVQHGCGWSRTHEASTAGSPFSNLTPPFA